MKVGMRNIDSCTTLSPPSNALLPLIGSIWNRSEAKKQNGLPDSLNLVAKKQEFQK